MTERLPIHGLTFDELRREARRRLTKGFGRARAVHRQAFWEARFAPTELDLNPRWAEAWREQFSFELPTVARVVDEDGERGVTSKAVLATADGLEHEMVSIPMGRGRQTLCISSQVGCKMACTFCETGRMGLLRHLSAAEIVGQLLVARHQLGWPVRNIVFMGMGEALDNADHVVQALRIFNDPCGLAIGLERVTICTVGHVQGIRRLRDERFKRLNLSVSLNAPDDPRRSAMMPINRRFPLAELQRELIEYRPRRNFTLGVNYCVIPGINDAREDAARVAEFCRPIARTLVNVIPYNPGNEPLSRAPSDDEIDRFIEWLRDEGVAVRRRVTKGRSVMAACGQLGNVDLRRLRPSRPRPSLE